MEISKQRFVSVQLSYDETREALEWYVRRKITHFPGGDLDEYKVEDYDPDCSRGKDKSEKGAFFLFLKEE